MTHFAESLKKTRQQLALTMQELADKSHVSKSMISKIERNEVQPTLDVAHRLSNALGKTLSEMLHASQPNQMVYLPRSEQPVWEDINHIKRRNIAPVFAGIKLEWLQVHLPKGTKITKAPAQADETPIQKYFLATEGSIEIRINQQTFRLLPGDSFYLCSNYAHEIVNCDDREAIFYVVVKYE